jgi:hypothetical protein
MIDLIDRPVEILYYSRNKLMLRLEDGRRVEVTPVLNNTAYDDTTAFLNYEALAPYNV